MCQECVFMKIWTSQSSDNMTTIPEAFHVICETSIYFFNTFNLLQYLFTFSENSTQPVLPANDPKNILVYGKLSKFWKNSKNLIQSLHDAKFKIHATLDETIDTADFSDIPDCVINHGILDTDVYSRLLSEMGFFLGLGFPYDGPAAMEAVAAGVVFIQPILDVTRENSDFLKNKPNDRKLTSQHGYLERFVGEPWVYTLDYGENFSEFENVKNLMVKLRSEIVLRKIKFSQKERKKLLKSGKNSLIPYEFSAAGMLERFFILIQGQNFCRKKWDLINSRESNAQSSTQSSTHSTQHYTINTGYLNAKRDVKILKTETTTIGQKGVSCDEVCDRAGRICDITGFGEIKFDMNSKSELPFCDEIEEVELEYSQTNLDKYGFSLPMVLEESIKEVDDDNYSHNKTNRHCIMTENKSDNLFSCSYKFKNPVNTYFENVLGVFSKEENRKAYFRLCPCLAVNEKQHSLCKECVF